jgi:hypothetical protein
VAWLQEFLSRFSEAFRWWFILQPWEQALRVRAGRWITKFEGGVHFRIPYLDAIFKQNCRMRVADCGAQTLTTKDNHTITLTGQLRYRVADVTPLYMKLHMAEGTLVSMTQEAVAEFVTARTREECKPPMIVKWVNDKIDFTEFGLADPHYTLPDYAVVKTLRLINDGFYTYSGNPLQTDRAEGADPYASY